MKKYHLLIVSLILILSITSCATGDEDTATKKDLISSKNWVIKSKAVVPSILFNGIEISDIIILDDESVRSYSFNFKSDGTLLQYDAEKKLMFQTTWSFNSSETELTFAEPIKYTYPVVGEMSITTLSIQSITSSKIVGTIPAMYEGVNYLITITFV